MLSNFQILKKWSDKSPSEKGFLNVFTQTKTNVYVRRGGGGSGAATNFEIITFFQ